MTPAVVLLLCLLILGVHGTPPLPSTYNASMCSESSRCGGVEIRYPFHLASATELVGGHYGEPYSCGYADLRILCQAGNNSTETPLLQLAQYIYTVRSISYDTSTILLADDADASLVAGVNSSCPVVSHNVTLFGTEWLHYADSSSLTFFLGCNDNDRGRFGTHQINCSGSGSSDPQFAGASYVFVSSSDGPLERELSLAGHCNGVVVVPVLKVALAGRNQSALPREYDAVLKQGFELGWNRAMADSPCYPCEQSGGRCSYSPGRVFLGCLCSDEKVGAQDCRSGSTSSHKKGTKIYIVASTSCLLVLGLLIIAFFLACKYGLLPVKSKQEPRIESFFHNSGNLHPRRYTYAEVKRMTNCFAVKLGQGGFGAVYRGNFSDGRQVAVKILKASKGDGEEFMNEVASISRTSHVNVVTLLGFCLQRSKRALIYEYMPNGSLERYAFNRNMKSENTLTWEKLFDIAIGIARGLEYLHRGCNTRIVHFDIKPQNILLDQDFCPKISDFGLAKLCLNKESIISIHGARGTIGYIAPEVYSKQFGTISSKSDVYSYGMMVLEMVGARQTNVNANSESSSQFFPQWIYEHLDQYCMSASEINEETSELVRKMIVVGMWCVQLAPTSRPTMTRVLEMLEASISNLDMPPKELLS